jgi:hypothetical protein
MFEKKQDSVIRYPACYLRKLSGSLPRSEARSDCHAVFIAS